MPTLTLKLGLLQHLHFPDIDVMQGVDGLAGLLDVLSHTVRDPVQHKRSRSYNHQHWSNNHLANYLLHT